MRPTVSGSQLNWAFCGPKGTSNQPPCPRPCPPPITVYRISPLANQPQGYPPTPKHMPIKYQTIFCQSTNRCSRCKDEYYHLNNGPIAA